MVEERMTRCETCGAETARYWLQHKQEDGVWYDGSDFDTLEHAVRVSKHCQSYPVRIIRRTTRDEVVVESVEQKPVTYRVEWFQPSTDKWIWFRGHAPLERLVSQAREAAADPGLVHEFRVIDSTGKVHAHFRRVTRTINEVEEVQV